MSSRDRIRPTGYWELISGNANFRWLWYGQIVSLLGDWFNLIASAALVASLTRSGFAVGGLFMVRMLAPFLASPVAGVVADRYDRKRILVWTDILRGVTVLGFLLVRDAGDVWLLYLLTAIQLGISGFFFTTRTAMLPDLVEGSAVGTANAITSSTWSTMLAVGAALGGLIAGTLGIYAAFVIDAGTFFLSALLISRIRLHRVAHDHAQDRTLGSAFWEYAAGLQLLFGRFDLLLIALHKAVLMLFFGTTFHVVQVAMAEDVFVIGRNGSLGVGLMFAVMGLGTGVSPLLVRLYTGDRESRMRWAIGAGYLIAAAGMLTCSLLTNLPVVLLGTLLVGLGDGLLWVFSTQLLLQEVPASVRGRAFATEFAFFSLASTIGAALVGMALDSPLGISGTLAALSLLSLPAAAVWAGWTFSWVRAARRASADPLAGGAHDGR